MWFQKEIKIIEIIRNKDLVNGKIIYLKHNTIYIPNNVLSI